MNNTKKLSILMSAVMICSAAANSGAAVFAADADNAVTVSKEAASDFKIPEDADSLIDFCENTKIACKDGTVYFGYISSEEKVKFKYYFVKKGKTAIDNEYMKDEFYTEAKNLYSSTDNSKTYYINSCKVSNDGILFLSNDDSKEKTAYEITGNEIKEITIYAAEREINNVPDCMPVGPEEYVDFCENKKAAAGDGLIVLGFIEDSEEAVIRSFDIEFNGEKELVIEEMGYTFFNDIDNTGKIYAVWKYKYLNDGVVVIKNTNTEEEYTYEISDNGQTVTLLAGSEDYEPGDIDGSKVTDLTDLSYLSLYLLGDQKFTSAQMLAADVTGDGEVDIRDLATLKQYICKDPDVVLKKYVK